MIGAAEVTVGLAVAGLFGLIGFRWVRDRRREAAVWAAAPARGWRIRKGPGAARWIVEGEHDGLPWTVTGRKVSGSDRHDTRSTTFVAPAPPFEGMVYAGTILPSAVLGIDVGSSLLQLAVRQPLGADDLRHVRASRPLDAPEILTARYSVMGSNPEEARRLLADHELRGALYEWPHREVPTVMRFRDRVEVRVPWLVGDPEDLDRLVALGARALAASLG